MPPPGRARPAPVRALEGEDVAEVLATWARDVAIARTRQQLQHGKHGGTGLRRWSSAPLGARKAGDWLRTQVAGSPYMPRCLSRRLAPSAQG